MLFVAGLFRQRSLPTALLGAGLALSLGSACPSPSNDDDSTTEPPSPPLHTGFEYSSAPVVCDSPAGLSPEFSEESQNRGLLLSEASGTGIGLADSSLAASDIDRDGDIDIVTADLRPMIYLNDGNGYFTALQVGPSSQGGHPDHIAVIDLDGDSLPEMIGNYRPDDPLAEHAICVWPNLGNATFGAPYFASTGYAGPEGEASTLAFGDVNGDGWVDVHHGKRYPVEGSCGARPEQIFLGSPEGYSSGHILELEGSPGGGGVATLVSALTDRDDDGDLDLIVLGGNPDCDEAEFGSVFYRNDGTSDGTTSMVNDAPQVGTNAIFSAMGFDGADLNSDGRLDYCASDVGPPRCYLSAGSDSWIEGAVSMGLYPDDPVYELPETIGWSLDLRDLNNDGHLDVLQASAPDHGGIWAGGDPFPDLLWLGQPGGTFSDSTEETAFGTTHEHVGMVTADFDGNGALDVLFHAQDGQDIPRLYMNRCTAGHWTNIEFIGPPENSEGIGARVDFNFDGQRQTREVYGLRATTQGPTRIHQGLGAADRFDLTVRWPDGEVTTAQELPVDRLVTALHPDASPPPIGDDDDQSSDDDDSATLYGSIAGVLTRSGPLAGDGLGNIYFTLMDPLLGAGPASIVRIMDFLEVDLAAEDSTLEYAIGEIPVTTNPIEVLVFLDDDLSGATIGPTQGDLVTSFIPTVFIDSTQTVNLDIVLDTIQQ